MDIDGRGRTSKGLHALSRRRSFRLQGLAVLLTTLWMRQHVIRQPWAHNPDEGELLVAAKRAAQSIIPFDRFTTTSYGPLWPMTLALLRHLGLPLSIPMAHLLATLLMVGTLVGLLHLARVLVGDALGFCLVATLTIVWASGGYPRHPDFLTLATELAPLALITAAMCVASRRSFDPRWNLFALLLVGAAPLFKYQFGFVALAAAAVLVFDGWRRDTGPLRRRIIAQAAALASPSIIILALVTFTGRAHFLVDEAIASVSGQINVRDIPFPLRAMTTSSFLLTQAFFLLPMLVAASAVLSHRTDHRRARTDATVMGIVFLTSYVSVIEMSFRFVHYSYIVLCASIVVAGFAASGAGERTTSTPSSRALPGLFICLGLAIGASYAYAGVQAILDRPMSLGWSDVLHARRSVAWQGRRAPDELSRMCPVGAKVFVWGWAGEMYSYYDWEPVSRYTIAPWITNGSNRSPLYTERLERELRSGSPWCIVEATGKSFHGNFTKKDSLVRTMPTLRPYLRRDYRERYVRASALRSSPMVRVYVLASS